MVHVPIKAGENSVMADSENPNLLHRFGRPPGWFASTLLVATAMVILVSVNIPGSLFLIAIFATLLLLGVSGWWAVRLLVWLIVNRKIPREKRWLTIPLLAIGSVLLTVIASDQHLVLRVARPWIERDVKQMMAMPTPPTTGWIGPLPVTDVKRVGDTLFFEVAGSGFLDHAGYAWTPTVPPDDYLHPYHRPIDGNWWTWEFLFD